MTDVAHRQMVADGAAAGGMADATALFFAAVEETSEAVGAIRAVRDADGSHVGDAIVYLNATIRRGRLGGMALRDVVGADPYALMPALTSMRELSRRVVASREPDLSIVELRLPDASARWIEQRLEPWGDGFLFFSRDITKEHALEAAAASSAAQRNALLRDALSALGDAVVVFRAVRGEDGALVDEVVEYANPAWCKTILASPDANPTGWRLTTDAPMLAERLPLHQQVIETGVPHRGIFAHADRTRWFDVGIVKFGDGVIVVSRDVTAMHAADEALRQREAELTRAQRVARTGSWTFDVATGALAWSDELYRIFGREPGSPLGSLVGPLATTLTEYTAESLERVRVARMTAIATGEPFQIDYEIVRADGTRRQLHARGEAVRDTDGAIRGLRGTVADVTEERAGAARDRLLVDESADAILRVEVPGGRILDANNTAGRLFGVDRSQLVGTRVRDGLLTGEQGWPMVGPALAAGETVAFEQSIPQPDGRLVLLSVRARQLPDGSVLASAREVTRERELEARLRQVERLETVGQLAGGIAHDFNNLLAAISGFAGLARASSAASKEVREDLDQILLASERAATLTRQLLAFSRRQALAPELVNPATAVQALLPMLGRLLGDHIRIQTTSSSDPGLVRFDPGQLEQVVVNLALNARDAMPDGGVLTIDCRNEDVLPGNDPAETETPSGPAVRLEFADTGVGMTPTVMSRIFEPFYTTKPLGEGSGMGLATVYGIIRQSGGRITARSTPRIGSSFVIELPRVDVPEPTTHVDAPIDAGGAVRAARDGTIMLVEDDPLVRASLARLIAKLGYRVIIAASGSEALELAEAHHGPLTALVTDVQMPGIQGPELARRLRDVRPDLPTLFVSGYSADLLAGRLRPEPGIAILQKPFGIDSLAAAIDTAIEGRG